jgi:hypothetical protein
MWGDTYPDDAADHAATWDELMGELDHAPADTPDRPSAGDQRPGSLDNQARYPNGVTAADRDPHYYDGDIQAALAAETGPTRQQAARDDHRLAEADRKQAAGLTEPSTVADGETYRSWEDGLPTRQESREKTWGPDAEFWDENEQAWRKFDTAPTPDADGAADTTGAGDRQRGEHPYLAAEHDDQGEVTSQADSGTDTPDRPAETDDALRQRVADLGKGMAELRSENADLRRGLAAVESRLDRMERAGADDPTLKSAKEQELSSQEVDNKRAADARNRVRPSDEALLFGAAGLGGAVLVAGDFMPFIPASAKDSIASGLAAAAAGIAWMRKHKESRNADRPEDREADKDHAQSRDPW